MTYWYICQNRHLLKYTKRSHKNSSITLHVYLFNNLIPVLIFHIKDVSFSICLYIKSHINALFGILFPNIYIIKYLKTIRRIICVQQIYTNCLCVSKSRPSIGLMIIVKNLENTFFEQEAHQNIFQLFKNFLRMFIFVIVVVFTVCVCAAFYYLEKFSLLYRMGVSVKIFKTEACIFSLYYCFIYTNMNNLIYMIFLYIPIYIMFQI